MCKAARGPEHPDGSRPAWRGRVDIISGATGGLLARVLNPEATFDSVFALGAAAVPDQDGDWIPDLVIGGVRLMLLPPAEEGQPATPAAEWRWWVASSATEQILRQGVGKVGAPGCEFLAPGPPEQTPEQFWAASESAGAQVFLPGIPGDLNGDGEVSGADAVALIGEWGEGGPGVPARRGAWATSTATGSWARRTWRSSFSSWASRRT